MQFKVDENLPVDVAKSLRQAGYDAVTVLEEHVGGSRDPKLALVCQEEERVLVTLDTDFADIRAIRRSSSPGSSYCASIDRTSLTSSASLNA